MSQRPSSRHGATGMQRPGSRGGMAPSMPVPAGGPSNPYVQAQPGIPGGAQAMAMASGRPGTGTRPGSGARALPGSRQGTAQPKNLTGIGLNTAVSVEHRPVTQQGMRGSTAAGQRAGPGRQIQDRNYFLGELRAKCTAVQEETDQLRKRAEDTRADNASYGALERRYESLSNEMRTLQGTLSDYNLLLDRSRLGREPADIFDEVAQLKASNAAEREQADALFNERKQAEQRIQVLEQQLYEHSQRLAARMSDLAPAQRELFARLQDEKGQLLNELPKKQAVLIELSEAVAQAEGQVGADSARAELAKLRDSSAGFARRQEELEREVADSQPLSPEAQKQKLFATVKQHKADIDAAERQILENQEAVKGHRQQIRAVSAELAKAGSAGGNAAGAVGEENREKEKYEQLLAKDAEMQALIDNYDETHAQETARLDALRTNIASLLTSISRTIEASAQVASESVDVNTLAQLKSELTYKEGQMEASERTAGRLVQERDKRHNELEKIKTLDSKIAHELEQLNDKMAAMSKELTTYRDLKKVKEDAEAKRKELTDARIGLKARQDASKRAGVQRKHDYEAAKKALADDETASTLEGLEQKLRHYESTVFMLSEYIHAKGRESDFITLKSDCMSLLNTLNNTAISIARR